MRFDDLISELVCCSLARMGTSLREIEESNTQPEDIIESRTSICVVLNPRLHLHHNMHESFDVSACTLILLSCSACHP